MINFNTYIKLEIETTFGCSPIVIHGGRVQGRRHGFSSGGKNRRQVANLSPKYPKNRKTENTPDLGQFILESGGDVPF